MAMALTQVLRGATVKLIEDAEGNPLKVQPMGVIARVRYRNKPDHIPTSYGIEHEDKERKRQCIYVDFGKGPQQVNASQLALHKPPTKAMIARLDNRALDAQSSEERELVATLAKPVSPDTLRVKEKATK